MTEVQQRPPGGKGADPSSARRALQRFLKAACALDAAWHPILECPTYPRYLPAFEVFLRDLQDWQEEAEDLPYTEPSEKRALNIANPIAVRTWLADLRTQISDATAAGEDAIRPPGRRLLGRTAARHNFREASRAIEQLLAAAERGAASAASG